MRSERALIFECNGARLVGILHRGKPGVTTALVIVVGGPQYRVGSHRQFVALARRIAAAGIPVLRFDRRGMGDAEGMSRAFDAIDEDIRAAVDCITATEPKICSVVLLGLCDGASANLMYAHTDERVAGLILMNPWVRTAQGEASTYLRHYYLQRLLQKSFWRKVLSGNVSINRAWRELLMMRRAAHGYTDEMDVVDWSDDFIERMLSGLACFQRPVLILISGRDLTAREFKDLCEGNSRWRRLTERALITSREFAEADHTFSEQSGLNAAVDTCLQWFRKNFQNQFSDLELLRERSRN